MPTPRFSSIQAAAPSGLLRAKEMGRVPCMVCWPIIWAPPLLVHCQHAGYPAPPAAVWRQRKAARYTWPTALLPALPPSVSALGRIGPPPSKGLGPQKPESTGLQQRTYQRRLWQSERVERVPQCSKLLYCRGNEGSGFRKKEFCCECFQAGWSPRHGALGRAARILLRCDRSPIKAL